MNMTSKNINYIFWLYGWNNTGRFLAAEDLVKCEIGPSNLYIETPALKIPIRSIRKCDAYFVGGSSFQRNMVKMKVEINNDLADFYFFPANPLEPANERSNYNEVNSFVEVINGILFDREVVLDNNPYYRNFRQRPNMDAEMDASISPWIYFHRFRKKTSITKSIIQILLTLIVLAVLIAILGLALSR